MLLIRNSKRSDTILCRDTDLLSLKIPKIPDRALVSLIRVLLKQMAVFQETSEL